MLVRLAETFYSIQGEGSEQGTPMYFVRLSGCAVAECVLHPANRGLCDTDWSFAKQRTCEEVVAEIPESVHWLCLTGGEPMEQRAATEELTRLAHRRNMRVMLQTSGKYEVPDIFDWLVVSPKQRVMDLVQRSGHELKLVYTGQDYAQLRAWHDMTKFHRYYLMPLHDGTNSNAKEVSDVAMKCCEIGQPWRMTLQSHKYIGVK
jgi:7-carboxy-7-deazaguanine synthase